jgi:Uma2 family endonuclease
MPTGTLLTIEDYERLPLDVVEHHELIDGELVEETGRTPRHNLLRDQLLIMLDRTRSGIVIACQGYQFQSDVYGPDISCFGFSKRPLLDRTKRVQRFVPDLAIEIASDSDTYQGLLLKKDRYLNAGTAEVWLFAPETREIAQYSKDRVVYYREKGQIVSDLLPGISIDLEELFQEL